MPGDIGDAFEPGDDRVQVDLQRPGEGGGGQGVADLARAVELQVHRRGAVEAVEHEPRAGRVQPLDARRDVHLGGVRHAEAHAAGVQVDCAQDLGMGVVGVDHRGTAGDDLAKEPGLGPAVLQGELDGQAVGHADVGHHGGLEGDPLQAAGVEGLGRDLEHAGHAVLIDHVAEDRRQAGCSRGPGPGDRPIRRAAPLAAEVLFAVAGAVPERGGLAVGPAQRADQPAPQAGGFEDRVHEQAGDGLAEGSGHAQGGQPPGGIAGQGLADQGVGRPGVVDNDLEPPGLGAGTLDDHPRGAPVEGFTHEGVAVVAGVANRHEDLAGVEPAMIVRTAGNFPVGAAHEMGFGEQSSQAHRGNSPLRQTVNEPACHRHTPPCLASRVSLPIPLRCPGSTGVNPFPPGREQCSAP